MTRYKTHKFKCFITLLFISSSLCGPIVNAQSTKSTLPNVIPGGIVLYGDSSGSFTGTVLINGQPFPFLIDTGADIVSVPEKMARTARLLPGKSYKITTASGRSTAYETRIYSLKIGSAEIYNLQGSVVPGLTQVLIGQNALKYFHMTQSLNKLTLVALDKSEELSQVGGATLLPADALPTSSMTPKKKWNKTVTCDSDGKHCKTSYR